MLDGNHPEWSCCWCDPTGCRSYSSVPSAYQELHLVLLTSSIMSMMACEGRCHHNVCIPTWEHGQAGVLCEQGVVPVCAQKADCLDLSEWHTVAMAYTIRRPLDTLCTSWLGPNRSAFALRCSMLPETVFGQTLLLAWQYGVIWKVSSAPFHI